MVERVFVEEHATQQLVALACRVEASEDANQARVAGF
jgi:hypothetical protein